MARPIFSDFAYIQCILADWLEKAAKSLELSENEKWPDNALDLAEVMYTAFSNVSQSTQERGVATPVQFATKVIFLFCFLMCKKQVNNLAFGIALGAFGIP